MKKILIFVFVAFHITIFAQTTIVGGTVSGTWSILGSPYLIQGSIMIPNDSTLTIEPGVNVNFQGTYKLVVLGKIVAVGTQTDTIVFSSSNSSNGWRGIRFDNTASSNDSSVIKYCKLIYGKATGGAPDDKGGAIYFNNFSKARIQNCNISYCISNSSGGGIYCNNSSPLISNNKIQHNATISNGAGGGIYSNNGSPIISFNTISNNVAQGGGSGGGGGIYCNGGSVIIKNNNIIDNQIAGNGGGGIYSNGGNVTISDNLIDGNSSQNNDGGGVVCVNGTTKILNNIIRNNIAPSCGGLNCSNSNGNFLVAGNLINNNTSTSVSSGASSAGGAGIYTWGNNLTFSNNIIANNNSSSCGGGVFCNQGSPSFVNNVICNNTASIGGAIFFFVSPSSINTNNTIVNNHANKGGGIYCYGGSDPNFSNTILWGNTSNSDGDEVYLEDEASDPIFNYCNIEGSSIGFGVNGNFYTGAYLNNLNIDPLFVSPSTGSGNSFNGMIADWSLQSTSSCINAGDPYGSYSSTDIIGHTRVIGGLIDIGAYEYGVSANNPTITFNGPTDFCQGDSVILTSSSANSFLWSNGDTTQIITVSVSGNYSVTVINSDSTSGTSAPITVTVNPLPPVPTISLNGATLTSSAITGNQWYFNGNIINGATFQNYIALQNGVYTVLVTDNKGCPSNSIQFNFTTLSLEEMTEINSIRIIPNPNNGIFYIESKNKQFSKITIFNMLGKIVYQAEFKFPEIDLTNLLKGVYFIQLTFDEKSLCKKLIVE